MIPIISITGTKGKTTVTGLVANVLQCLGHNVLKVDTSGHFMNGVRRSTLQDSKQVWNVVPTRLPGRYLWEFFEQPEYADRGVAVLESSIGCAESGLGYRHHDIGVFLNVFEDHMGTREHLKTREDIAIAKSFVFNHLRDDTSRAIFNADDPLVSKAFFSSPVAVNLSQSIAVGMTLSEIDQDDYLTAGGVIVTLDTDGNIILRSDKSKFKICSLRNVALTFSGTYEPGVVNTLFTVAVVLAFYNLQLPDNFKQVIESITLPEGDGRMNMMIAQNGTRILVDYAHEEVSLRAVATFARQHISHADGKLRAVVRLSYRKNGEDLIRRSSRAIAEVFDDIIVYDKLPSERLEGVDKTIRDQMHAAGELLYETVKGGMGTASVQKIDKESEAIATMALRALPEDLVVVIANDDTEKTIEYVKSAFSAKVKRWETRDE